jgi:hypothetical protein
MQAKYKDVARWTALWLAIWALAMGMLVAFTKYMPDPAHAAAQKHVVERRDTWTETRSYSAPNSVGVGTHIETYQDSISTDYQFWPDGDGINKIAVIGVWVCYHRTQGNGTLFQGVNGNTYYFDDDDDLNVGDLAVNDDGTANNCNHYVIPNSFRKWFKMSQSPAWRATGKLRIAYTNDQNFNFTWAGSTTKYFHPGDDLDISDWYYCDCVYGPA